MPSETSTRRRIYVASSWRNLEYPALVAELRAEGHEVYDFRNAPHGASFARWDEIDPGWTHWTPERYSHLVTTHPRARQGFDSDKAALDWCDTCVLLLPCGRSAHLEAGYASGQGKEVVVRLSPERFEPELMYLLCSAIAQSDAQVLAFLRRPVHVACDLSGVGTASSRAIAALKPEGI